MGKKEKIMEKYEWRPAIFNQIYTTRYYHVRKYQLNPITGKYRYTDETIGHRGPGGHLGYTSKTEAKRIAQKLNSKK